MALPPFPLGLLGLKFLAGAVMSTFRPDFEPVPYLPRINDC